GVKTEAVVVVAELADGNRRGRGECVPYLRYGETVESVPAQIEGLRPQIEGGLDRRTLQAAMPPGAARNALDCAFWDLESKRSGRPVNELAGIAAPAGRSASLLRAAPPSALTTAFTISRAAPADMAKAAAKAASRALLKIKLGADGDSDRMAAVRNAAPKATLIVDANEGWTDGNLGSNLAACAQAGVA